MLSQDTLANFQNRPTPFYYYDMELLRQTAQKAMSEAAKYGYHLHYAVKANFNTPILQELAGMGFGADCVSGREVELAVQQGFSAKISPR